MRNKKSALKKLCALVLLMIVVVACDKDFISLDSDISGENNFGVADQKYEVISYNKPLGPIQTNGLPANLLGVYKDRVYGNSTASVVTQLTPAVLNPKFADATIIDSVVVTIPYFSKAAKSESGANTYKLDSIFGSGAINLKVYENKFFLRNFDPSSGFEAQNYYSNRTLSDSRQIPLASLQGTLLKEIEEFTPSNKEIKLKKDKDSTFLAPAIRFKMDPSFWNTKIIAKGGSSELSNVNNFQNYFRGIYFEAEAVADNGSMMLLNFNSSDAHIIIYYSSPPLATDGDRQEGSYRLNFTNDRINFFDNDFVLPIPEGNPTTGDEKLYIKGGQGSVAVINLFGGTDVDSDQSSMSEFEQFKNDFVETDASGKFVKAKRLINEANLIFHVDQQLTQGQEPDRIYIYDVKNQIPLADYTYDVADVVNPNDSRTVHMGKLKRVSSDKDAQGVQYKIKITEHIKNLLMKDSTNVGLGISLSVNVNAESFVEQNSGQIIFFPQKSIQSSDNNQVKSVPLSHVISPKGTVLYGNKANDDNKKLYLEIFYTEPNN